MSRSVGCGATAPASLIRVLAQYPDHAAQLLECLAGRDARRAAVCLDLLRGQVRAHLEPTGVQRHQRDPVRQDVVHLARDARPFGHPGLLLVQLLVGLGPQRSLAQATAAAAGGPG